MNDRVRWAVYFGLFMVTLLVPSLVGAAEAHYRLRGGDTPVDHSVNGYSQSVEVIGDGVTLVRVSVPAVAIGAAPGGFEPDPRVLAGLPEGFGLPDRLKAALTPGLDAYSRATAVLKWVGRFLSLDNSGTGDQDAFSVLSRGNGRCSGLANATVALLRAAGFEARTVSGLLVSDGRIVPHRWLECHLPGAGWVPTDPTIGFWVLTARHLVFAGTVTDIPEVGVVVSPDATPSFPVVDGVQTRPDQGSELVFRVVNPCGGSVVAVLRNAAGMELRTLLDKDGRFSGLVPGRWRLEVQWNEKRVMLQTLELGLESHHSMVVKIDPETCD